MKPKTRKILGIAIVGIAAIIALLGAAAVVLISGLSQGQWG